MRCYVCGKETHPRQRYCDRCRIFVTDTKEQMKRRAALREAYDQDHDGFRCHWSGILLDEIDRDGPFSLCFDHLVPVRTSKLVVSSALFNLMKCELTDEEFLLAIKELADHLRGQEFDKNLIKFTHWNVKAPSPTGPGRRPGNKGLGKVNVPECIICGRPPLHWSYYCSRCRPFVVMHPHAKRLHARAMREAWSKEQDGFCCHYTGVRLNERDTRSPWFLSFDHGIPGDDQTLVVAAFWVNAMKTALSEAEFWAVVLEYDRYLREGGEFDRDVAEFRYWKRTRGKRT